MKRGKRVFTVRSRFAKGDRVYQKGTGIPLMVERVAIALPGYETSDGRFFSEDELRARPQRPERELCAGRRRVLGR